MLQSSFFPLRSLVGKAISVRKLDSRTADCTVIDQSAAFLQLGGRTLIKSRASLGETIADPIYGEFLPEVNVDGVTFAPGEGMATLPLPKWQPFPQNAPLLSLFFLAKKESAKTARDMSLRLRIKLGQKKLVGGVCFSGLPYLPYRITSAGENSSNFGVPREVRLTCLGGSQDHWGASQNTDFLDSEIATTRQEMAWHSGFQFVLVDPTLTDELILHLSDLPSIVTRVRQPRSSGDGRERYVERFGFALPYFYIFEYSEQTRYRPLVAGGFLASLRVPAEEPLRLDQQESTVSQSWQNEYRLFVKGSYYDFTAQSAIDSGRTYGLQAASGTRRPRRMQECFISQRLKNNQKVILYFEQSEEYSRCLSGMRAFFPFAPATNLTGDIRAIRETLRVGPSNGADFAALLSGPAEELDGRIHELLGIPAQVRIANSIGVRIFELDPVEGMSPLQTDLDGKYATLLADLSISRLTDIFNAQWTEGIKFSKPSSGRYFAVEITNLSSGPPASVVLKNLEFVQSAHIFVQSRAARVQQVKAVHFRLVGKNLADDYATLGQDGFNFSVEWLSGGQTKAQLFRANSLFDLLHGGSARLYSNSRRRGVEFENVAFNAATDAAPNLGGGHKSYEIRSSQTYSDGWRRAETGSNKFNGTAADGTVVKGKNAWYGAMPHWNGEPNPDTASATGKVFSFSTLGNREIRTHSENVFPERIDPGNNSNEWNAMRAYLNSLGTLGSLGLGGFVQHQLVPDTVRLGSSGWNVRGWSGLAEVPLVTGQRTFAVNPLASLVKLTNLIDDIANNRPFDPTIFGALLLGNIPLLLSGGGNSSMSVSPVGIGVSIGIEPTPTINFTYTVGSFGNVSVAASEENYSYAQSRNRAFDEGRLVSYSEEGNQNRIVTHKEVPGTDAQRVRGAEILWQGQAADILCGTIPLNFTLAATADKNPARTFDDLLRIRLGSGVGSSLSVDFWFDIDEEFVRDDY
jgi:hypothetical protein